MSAEPEALIDELRQRFPLFERIVGQFGEDTGDERIPWFFGLLLAAASNRVPGACCFVLDKTRGTTPVAAILLAFVRLQEDFPELVHSYADAALRSGQRVRVKPSDFVYEYNGLWDGYPGHFRLKIIGEEEYRTFPMVDVLRLEPTERVRPKGALNSNLGAFERSWLDELLDLTTCGNNSLIRNHVLTYMAQTQFSKIVDAIAFAPRSCHYDSDRVSRHLPWGSIAPDGRLNPNDSYQVAGEPIIGVTTVPEDLALASSSAPVGTKVVLVEGARGVARDLQAFDDIADRQKTLILASPEETDALILLKDRGCPVWYMSPTEMMIGEPSGWNRVRGSLVGRTIRAADTRQHVTVTLVDCEDRLLQTVAESLDRAAGVLRDDDGTEGEEILSRLFAILFEYSECCFGVDNEIVDNLQIVRNKLTGYGNWFVPEVATLFEEAITRLEDAIGHGPCGQEKAAAMIDLIGERQNEPLAVTARSPRTAGSLRRGLADQGFDVPVLTLPAISSEFEYARVIVPAWPNERKFIRLKTQAVTRDIRVLSYPFETKWIRRHQVRERARQHSSRMDIQQRSSILGIGSQFVEALGGHETAAPEVDVSHDLPIFRIEERLAQRPANRPSVAREGEDAREAQLVQFFGDCHALLTDWAALPRLNHLVDNPSANEASLPTVTASQLAPGDYLLFRVSGDKGIIRLIAEDALGTEEYDRIRASAERWKISLRRLGASPVDVQRRLAAAGLNRARVTVASWLGSEDRIGPRSLRDIEAIAKASQDAELARMHQECWNAIGRIRGAHIAAGGQLTQLILGELGGRLQQLDDQPVLLDLDYGKAWVVQVDMVETTRRMYPFELVNRLLWAHDSAF